MQGTKPQLLPGCRSIKGCPLLRVCVCALWMGKCRAQIPSMGHHTWSYVTSYFFLYKVIVFNIAW